MEKILIFMKGRGDSSISRLDSGKIILLLRGGNSSKVQIGEAWECLVEEKERFCLATPVARHEEKDLIAKQGNLFWQVKSGRVIIREEEVSDYNFIFKPHDFFNSGYEIYVVVEGVEKKIDFLEYEEFSGNKKFQKILEEKTVLEKKEREVKKARAIEKDMAEAKKTFSAIARALEEKGEFVFPGAVPLSVQTLSEEWFAAVAFDGRELQVSRKGGWHPTGFTFRDDSDDMEWRASFTSIELGEKVSEEGLTTLPGFEGFMFETHEANRKRLEEERLTKKIAEAEIAQAKAVRLERYNVWQGSRGDIYKLFCMCRKNRSDFVYGTVDAEGKQCPHWMCGHCLTEKARALLAGELKR